MIVIIACLAAIFFILSGGIYFQYRRHSGRYREIAMTCCDPGSWRISFFLRTLVLSGKIGDRTMRYSVFGDDRKKEEANSYLLFEYPVKRNFRFYAGSDVELADPDIRGSLAELQAIPEFRALIVTSRDTPLLGSMIARPLGFGYKPGLLLWKLSNSPFDPEVIKNDFLMLVRLAEQGM
jgi:hypothetical protein